MLVIYILKKWFFLCADVFCISASGSKRASGRWIDRGGHIALKDDSLALRSSNRVCDRNCREQGLCIRMHHIVIELINLSILHKISEVHHADFRRDVTNHREIVGDEEIGEMKFFLKLLENVDDLCLNRDIECRNRLIADDEFRLGCERAGNADSLSLTT